MKRPTGTNVEVPLVRIEEAFDVPREQVFDAWVLRDLLEQWFAPDGCTLHIAHLDAREGGGYHRCIKNPSLGACWTIGSFIEVVRPERLVFTTPRCFLPRLAFCTGVPECSRRTKRRIQCSSTPAI